MSNTVMTTCGEVRGTTCQWDGVVAYKGIRYATAGRFEYPVEVTHWHGVYEANEYGNCSFQPRAFYDEEAVIEYPVGYFFSGNAEDEDYVIIAPEEQQFRQLSAQYPKSEVIARSAVMGYFDKEANEDINQMWINIRCFNLSQITAAQWRNAGIVIIVVAGCIALFALRKKNI